MLFKKKTYKKRTKVTKAKASTKLIRNIVKKTLVREAEKKTVSYQNTFDFSMQNIGQFPILQTGNITTDSFTIAQGAGQADRIGNIIKLHKVTLDLIIFPLGYDSQTNINVTPQEVRMILASNRNSLTLPPPASGMFNYGDLSQDPQQTLMDQILSINTDKWIVKKQRFAKIGYSLLPGNPNNVLPNNDFKLNHKMKLDITKYCPSHMRWNDTSKIPYNSNLYLTFITSTADGTSTASTQTKALRCVYNINCEYTDN